MGHFNNNAMNVIKKSHIKKLKFKVIFATMMKKIIMTLIPSLMDGCNVYKEIEKLARTMHSLIYALQFAKHCQETILKRKQYYSI